MCFLELAPFPGAKQKEDLTATSVVQNPNFDIPKQKIRQVQLPNLFACEDECPK